MKRMLLAMAALPVLAAAVPAAAQYSGRYYDDNVIERRLDELRVRIDRGVQRGAIGRAEAIRLQDEWSWVRRLEQRYDDNGLDARERAELYRRLYELRDRIAYAESFGTYDRDPDGWDDRYDPDRGWADDPYDFEPRDDWDYDREGRWDDDRPYDPSDDSDWYEPGAPGGAWDDRTERWDDGPPDGYAPPIAELRVGQRAPVNLNPVPPAFRDLYRDGNGVYYRYDDGRVFQIDERTHMVRWIGNLPY